MILEDLVTYVANSGIGTAGIDIFIDTIPLTAGDAIMFVVENSLDQNVDYDLRTLMVNVYCRNSSDQQGQQKMEAIRLALGRLGNIQLTGNYLCFCNTTSVESIGKDAENNSQFRMSLKIDYYTNTAI